MFCWLVKDFYCITFSILVSQVTTSGCGNLKLRKVRIRVNRDVLMSSKYSSIVCNRCHIFDWRTYFEKAN